MVCKMSNGLEYTSTLCTITSLIQFERFQFSKDFDPTLYYAFSLLNSFILRLKYVFFNVIVMYNTGKNESKIENKPRLKA